MVKLHVKCKGCKQVFRTQVQMDEQSFQTTTMHSNQYGCPNCGQVNEYRKEDHFFAES